MQSRILVVEQIATSVMKQVIAELESLDVEVLIARNPIELNETKAMSLIETIEDAAKKRKECWTASEPFCMDHYGRRGKGEKRRNRADRWR